jgi:L-aminopeptidase/D-esterase-like protein
MKQLRVAKTATRSCPLRIRATNGSPAGSVPQREVEVLFPGLRIGVAEYSEGPTGCTVILMPPAQAQAYKTYGVVDTRGGIPGVVWPGDGPIGAVCFTGGSLDGLEALWGMNKAMYERDGYRHRVGKMPLSAAACIYDYVFRDNDIHPDRELGYRATLAATGSFFPCGRRGAGINATCGKCFDVRKSSRYSGQGAAYERLGGLHMAFFVVVNAMGLVHDRGGQLLGEVCTSGECNFKAIGEASAAMLARSRHAIAEGRSERVVSGNTVLSLLLTNISLREDEQRQLARQVHVSMARFIHPFHTWHDGDVLFCVSTNEVERGALKAEVCHLGDVASDLAGTAIERAFWR